MDGEHFWLFMTYLHGITGITTIIYMQGGQSTYLDRRVARQQVKIIFYVWRICYLLIGRCVKRLY